MYLSSSDARFIEKLFPEELRDLREAQADRRWKRDAISSLELEVKRLSEILGDGSVADFSEVVLDEKDSLA